MKAKDIALLCTAAAGAGAAAGAAMGTVGKNNGTKQTAAKNNNRPTAKKQPKAEMPRENHAKQEKVIPAKISPIDIASDNMSLSFAEEADGIITAIFADGKNFRAFRISEGASEIRCPANPIGAASLEECTLYITRKGGIFVYADPEKEPVFCALTAPRYVSAFSGEFYVFSDSLLYICTTGGEIRKTVSLCAMIEITGSDICDAENSDDSFSSSEVKVKKAYPLKNTPFAAIITEDGRSYLMHCDNDFYCFEKTYENIIDVCTYGSFAYYLYRSPSGYGIIKTRLNADRCDTEAKYHLCGAESEPVGILSGRYGIGVLYKGGQVKFLLPEIPDGSEKEECRSRLRSINAAFADIAPEKIFRLSGSTACLEGGKFYTVE